MKMYEQCFAFPSLLFKLRFSQVLQDTQGIPGFREFLVTA